MLVRGTVRPGHHQPLGTTARMRFIDWSAERQPALGDLAVQTSGPDADDADVVRRCYRVVGVEEGRDRATFRLVMERVDWSELGVAADAAWAFHNVPRKA